jgi:lysyl-tRNA synthetase class 2
MVSSVLWLVARGLRVGHRLAWVATVVTLVLHAAVQLSHHVHPVASTLVIAAGVWLACQWRAFPVLPDRRTTRQVVLLTGAAALVTAVDVTLRALRVTTSNPFWHTVAAWGDRAVIVAGVTLVAVAAWRLTSPRRRALPAAAHRAERERARRVVRRHGGGSLDYFALRDDKDWFFVGRSVVAYAVRGGVCLVSPDPIGPPAERARAWAEFAGFAARQGWSIVVVAAAEDWLPVYEFAGLQALYLGDIAVVDAPAFDLDGHDRKSIRRAHNRIARAGYTTTFHDPAQLARADPELCDAILAMSAESRRGEDERGFSMSLSRLFDPADAGLLLSVTRTPAGRVDAYCQWVPARDGWSLDVMRRRTDADLPNGLIDFTLVETIFETARRGGRTVSLNFAAFRETLAGERPAPLGPITRPVIDKLNESAQVTSLAPFNEKYGPSWERRFFASSRGDGLPYQVAAAVGAEGAIDQPLLNRLLDAIVGS